MSSYTHINLAGVEDAGRWRSSAGWSSTSGSVPGRRWRRAAAGR
jgi:hypothetical protein